MLVMLTVRKKKIFSSSRDNNLCSSEVYQYHTQVTILINNYSKYSLKATMEKK